MSSMTGSDYTKKDKFRCQLISWGEAARMSQKLANIVQSSGYRPDIIIAIGRGGYVPARILCDYLLFRDLTSIKIEHWGVAATIDKEAHIRFGLSTDISGQKVLVVDDITDTGDTLQACLEYIRKLGPEEVRTAVLQHKTCSFFEPDYYVHRIIKWRWIIYPWAAFEDLSGFIERILVDDYISEDDIKKRLFSEFQLSLDPGHFSSILRQMELSGLIKHIETDGTVLWNKS